MLYNPEWKTKVEPWRGLLANAALVIEERGWCKYELESSNGEYCMLGAMHIAYYGQITPVNKLENHAKDFLLALEKLQTSLSMEPWTWNDTMGRTKEEVVSKLIEVANAVGK